MEQPGSRGDPGDTALASPSAGTASSTPIGGSPTSFTRFSEQTHSTVLERIADSLAAVILHDAFTIYQADEASATAHPS